MGYLNNLKRALLGKARPNSVSGSRAFNAAIVNRLTSDWTTTNKSINAELRSSLRPLRARSRDLVQNNDYAKKLMNMVAAGVVGPKGIILQARVLQDDFVTPDKVANDKIERAWTAWGRRGICTMDGRLSWQDAENLIIKSIARDGEILIRKIPGRQAGNDFGFAIQLIEADHLDEDLCRDLGSGNRIYMGVETNQWSRPVAYHVLTRHPGDETYLYGGRRYLRIPADEIIHPFVSDRAQQTRGVPWMHAGMQRLQMLGGYEEAELTAARVSAAKMGFITTPTGEDYPGDDTDAFGNTITEAEPGSFEQLPAGSDMKMFDPKHPTDAFGTFCKTMLRGFAAGVGVSYNGLANDLEGVNFSSLRHGLNDERDGWRVLQTWLISSVHDQVFEEWLTWSLTTGALALPMNKFAKFNHVIWQPRGWAWVDPEKEIKANILAIDKHLKSRSEIMGEQGRDLTNTFQQLKSEQELASTMGLTLTDANTDQPMTPSETGDTNAETENN